MYAKTDVKLLCSIIDDVGVLTEYHSSVRAIDWCKQKGENGYQNTFSKSEILYAEIKENLTVSIPIIINKIPIMLNILILNEMEDHHVFLRTGLKNIFFYVSLKSKNNFQ